MRTMKSVGCERQCQLACIDLQELLELANSFPKPERAANFRIKTLPKRKVFAPNSKQNINDQNMTSWFADTIRYSNNLYPPKKHIDNLRSLPTLRLH